MWRTVFLAIGFIYRGYFFLVCLTLAWEEEQPRPLRCASAAPNFFLCRAHVLPSPYLCLPPSLPPFLSASERAIARTLSVSGPEPIP